MKPPNIYAGKAFSNKFVLSFFTERWLYSFRRFRVDSRLLAQLQTSPVASVANGYIA